MTILSRNGVTFGCERDGHSVILCHDCIVDMKNCPAINPVEEKPTISYQSVAKEIATLVAEKQLKYSDSFGKADQVMKVFYPNGISSSQLRDALTVLRIVDKLFRISNGNQGDEDGFEDLTGYGILATTRNRREELN
jgi:hypothetical protein